MLLGFKYGAEVDWWALGFVMYERMVGQHPFKLPKRYPYCEKIFKNSVAYPRRLTVSAVSILMGGKHI
jgi:serine/threonine protein kinase